MIQLQARFVLNSAPKVLNLWNFRSGARLCPSILVISIIYTDISKKINDLFSV